MKKMAKEQALEALKRAYRIIRRVRRQGFRVGGENEIMTSINYLQYGIGDPDSHTHCGTCGHDVGAHWDPGKGMAKYETTDWCHACDYDGKAAWGCKTFRAGTDIDPDYWRKNNIQEMLAAHERRGRRPSKVGIDDREACRAALNPDDGVP
jgi:hypothetical protein